MDDKSKTAFEILFPKMKEEIANEARIGYIEIAKLMNPEIIEKIWAR